MDRCKEYCGFAISFAGLGYIALWPLAALASRLLGVAPHPLALPPALQATGMLAAIFVIARLLLLMMRRLRRQYAPQAAHAPDTAVKPRVLRREPLRHLPQVKPRSQFGLRGTPR
jgi:hypothetical protein